MIEGQIYPRPVKIELENIPVGNRNITKIVDDSAGLRIFFSCAKELVSEFGVKFNSIHSYRLADESDRMMYWESLGGYLTSLCYEASLSDFLDWTKEQSPFKEVPSGLKHYIISSSNDVLDILSFDEPIVITDKHMLDI